MPLLEATDGQMINESAVCMQFAMDYGDADVNLFPVGNAMAGAKQRLLMLEFDSLFGPFWNAFRGHFKKKTANKVFVEKLPLMEAFISFNLQGDFLGGDRPMMIDIHVFAMLDRINLLENSPWHAAFEDMSVRDRCP